MFDLEAHQKFKLVKYSTSIFCFLKVEIDKNQSLTSTQLLFLNKNSEIFCGYTNDICYLGWFYVKRINKNHISIATLTKLDSELSCVLSSYVFTYIYLDEINIIYNVQEIIGFQASPNRENQKLCQSLLKLRNVDKVINNSFEMYI